MSPRSRWGIGRGPETESQGQSQGVAVDASAAAPGAIRQVAPHASGARPPEIAAESMPRHIAIVMDGNGRWAQQRGLPRTKGHEAGEKALLDVVSGAIELGLEWLSVYAFSTENWRRPADEVRFLMTYNEDVLAKRRDELNELNVRIRWAGVQGRLAARAVRGLAEAEELTKDNTGLTLCMCINYGGRAELAEAAAAVAREVAAGRLDPDDVDEAVVGRYLDEPDMPDVDLFIRTSGEQRLSNFLLWQSAYAELAFVDDLWPDFDRLDLWRLVEEYATRARRFGGV